ncbi:MAG: helix-turn-helix transcriptional regulator [Christensenellaceae bacterium]
MERKLFGKRLNEARKAKGITSERLSELCEVNATHIRGIEGGRRFPSVELLVKMCNALQTSPNYLLQDLLCENEVAALKDLSSRCATLSKPQLERLNQMIDLIFAEDK